MSSPAPPAPSTLVPARESLDPKYTWDLSSIFGGWDAWETAFAELGRGIEAYRKYEGTLSQGSAQLLGALRDRDALAQLSYRVWYYPSLQYDEDQRNNTINARRQRVQLLIAKWQQATSWFQPDLLKLPLETRLMILSPVDVNLKGEHDEMFIELRAKGFVRLWGLNTKMATARDLRVSSR